MNGRKVLILFSPNGCYFFLLTRPCILIDRNCVTDQATLLVRKRIVFVYDMIYAGQETYAITHLIT